MAQFDAKRTKFVGDARENALPGHRTVARDGGVVGTAITASRRPLTLDPPPPLSSIIPAQRKSSLKRGTRGREAREMNSSAPACSGAPDLTQWRLAARHSPFHRQEAARSLGLSVPLCERL
jgi:hypothetical protein